jgi:hypothetical protein
MPALRSALQSLSGVILGAGLVEFGVSGLMNFAKTVGEAYDKLSGFKDLETQATAADKEAAEASDKYTQSIRNRITALITLNMTEAERLKFSKDQAASTLTNVRGEIAQLEAQRNKLAASVALVPSLQVFGAGDLISSAADVLLNRNADKQIEAVESRLHSLKLEEQDLVMAVEQFGQESQKAFGEDAAKAVQKLERELVSAYGDVQKVLGGDKMAEQLAELNAAGKVFAQAGINAGPLLSAAFSKVGNDAAVAFSTGLMNNVQKETDELKGVFENIGFDPAQFATGLMGPDVNKSIAAVRAELGAQTEEERVRAERLQQQGYDRLAIEQQIGAERQNQLSTLAAQLNDLQAGKNLTDQQRAEVKKLSEEIQLLGGQSHAVATQLMHDFHDGLGNAFVGLITRTETFGQAFRNMATQILADIAKMTFETMIWKSALGFLNNSDFFSGLAGGTLFGSGGVFGSHAGGGPVQAGMPGLINETGASEVFIPNVDGRIVPASDFARDGGGRGGDTYIINAPGADAGSEERIMSIMRAFAPTLLAQAVVQNNDYARRTR